MSQPTNKEYIIEKITDLDQLDHRQLIACLDDLKTFISFRQKMTEGIKTVAEQQGLSDLEIQEALNSMQPYMNWIDDGESNGALKVTVVNEDGTTFEGEFPAPQSILSEMG